MVMIPGNSTILSCVFVMLAASERPRVTVGRGDGSSGIVVSHRGSGRSDDPSLANQNNHAELRNSAAHQIKTPGPTNGRAVFAKEHARQWRNTGSQHKAVYHELQEELPLGVPWFEPSSAQFKPPKEFKNDNAIGEEAPTEFRDGALEEGLMNVRNTTLLLKDLAGQASSSIGNLKANEQLLEYTLDRDEQLAKILPSKMLADLKKVDKYRMMTVRDAFDGLYTGRYSEAKDQKFQLDAPVKKKVEAAAEVDIDTAAVPTSASSQPAAVAHGDDDGQNDDAQEKEQSGDTAAAKSEEGDDDQSAGE